MVTPHLNDPHVADQFTSPPVIVLEPKTWAEVCEVEPALLHLEERARFLGTRLRRRNRELTWVRFKRQIETVAGGTARKRAMCGAYDLVYRRLLAAFEKGGRR